MAKYRKSAFISSTAVRSRLRQDSPRPLPVTNSLLHHVLQTLPTDSPRPSTSSLRLATSVRLFPQTRHVHQTLPTDSSRPSNSSHTLTTSFKLSLKHVDGDGLAGHAHSADGARSAVAGLGGHSMRPPGVTGHGDVALAGLHVHGVLHVLPTRPRDDESLNKYHALQLKIR